MKNFWGKKPLEPACQDKAMAEVVILVVNSNDGGWGTASSGRNEISISSIARNQLHEINLTCPPFNNT